VGYFGGDDRTKWKYELRVFSDSEETVDIRLEPLLHYEESEILFGFDGEPEQRPEILGFVNRFVVRGQSREQTPELLPGDRTVT
jgi:hypothetical protein